MTHHFDPDRRYDIEYLGRASTLQHLPKARYTGRDGDEFVFEADGRLVKLHRKLVLHAEPR